MSEETLSYNDTIKSLTQFHDECLKYWQREGKTFEDAVLLARKDVKNAQHDPFEPKGRLLNKEAQEELLRSMHR